MNTPYDTRLPPHLRALKQEIEGYARGYGLDFYETIFEVIDAEDLNEIAAYGGFPTRYPHWSFGMAFEELKKGYDYGLSKIYEMVINNDPCYAYLMRSNHTVDQKLVMAHVYGHCDFFKNNAYFGHTSRKMMDEMANHGTRIRGYAEKIGEDEVEAFVDRCMSIDDLIDIHSTAIRRRRDVSRYDFTPEAGGDGDDVRATRFKSKDYMDDYINPRDVLKAEEDERRKARDQQARNFPEQPEKDVLLFLIEHAPLKAWQRDVLSIIRDEAYYFAPQGQTKILNEGWACVAGHSLVVTDRGLVRMADLVRGRQSVTVSDGEGTSRVSDWARFPSRETVKVRTARGLELEGSVTHQVRLADGTWRRLDEVAVGDSVEVARGADLWPAAPVVVDAPAPSGWDSAEGGVATARRIVTRLAVDERVGSLLGRLAVDHRPEVELPVGTKEALLGGCSVLPRGGLSDVPEVILRSPRGVVVAFLRACFAAAGRVSGAGIGLSGVSADLSRSLQLLLLNLGIDATRTSLASRWSVEVTDRGAVEFLAGERADLPGAGRGRVLADAIVSVERGRADVFDVTVAGTHRYAAQGFVNHNSYWHSTIMTQKALSPSEVIDYADHHSGTMAMSRTRLNPYKLGIELLRDVEMRWNTGRFGKEFEECDDLDRKRAWDLGLGLGRQKIFEVRRIHNDITFIDNFLTPEFCVQHNLFSFAYQEQAGQYIIESREFAKIKQRLLFSLTNFGKPWITVVDGNHRNRGELLLRHQHSGAELKLDHAADTLANIQHIWGRPVHLETLVDGKPTVLSFDGTDHSIKTGGDADDAKRSAPAKPR